MLDQIPLAHGIGGPEDLPIPLGLTIAGGVAALVVSFAVLALAWRKPRYARMAGRPAPRLTALVRSTAFTLVTRAFGLALFGYTAWAAFAGPDLLINPFFGMIYVLLWVGLVPLSLIFGSFWRTISPLRTLHLLLNKATGGDRSQGMYDLPDRLGYWPAALGLFAFVWMELVYPNSAELGPLSLWVSTYVAIMLIGSAVFGEKWFERADPFEVFSTLVGHLSVWGRDADDRIVIRSPLANLARVDVRPGLVGVVAVLFGSTAFDSFHSSERWVGYIQTTDFPGLSRNGALLGFCVLAGVLFSVAARLTSAGPDVPKKELPDRLAHSMMPIVVGYFVAHYLSFFVINGQQTLIQMSDPMVTGANLLGTAGWQINDWLVYHPTLLATVKVLGVVIGHVVAVVSAHDRAIEVLPRSHQITGQLAMLLVMVVFTVSGLGLLFAK